MHLIDGSLGGGVWEAQEEAAEHTPAVLSQEGLPCQASMQLNVRGPRSMAKDSLTVYVTVLVGPATQGGCCGVFC